MSACAGNASSTGVLSQSEVLKFGSGDRRLLGRYIVNSNGRKLFLFRFTVLSPRRASGGSLILGLLRENEVLGLVLEERLTRLDALATKLYPLDIQDVL